MSKRQSGPDLSATPRLPCACGGNCPLERENVLRARRCQGCWRDNLPCIKWHTKLMHWLCGWCRTKAEQPPEPETPPEPAVVQESLFNV